MGKEKIQGFDNICGEIFQLRGDTGRYGYLKFMTFNICMLKKGQFF